MAIAVPREFYDTVYDILAFRGLDMAKKTPL